MSITKTTLYHRGSDAQISQRRSQENAFGRNHRVYRQAGIGANLLTRKPDGGAQARNYPAVAIGKILGGNLLRVIRQVLPKSIAHP